MIATKIDLPNGSRVFVVDDYLPIETLELAHSICDLYPSDSDVWHSVDWTTNRFQVNKQHSLIKQLWKQLLEVDVYQQLEFKKSVNLQPVDFNFWIDLPGMGTLQPHVEGADGGTYLTQIYITRQNNSTNGTTIYTDDRQVLLQLPYRDNLGWFFDTADKVMHGREHKVPADLNRFGLMIWYKETS